MSTNEFDERMASEGFSRVEGKEALHTAPPLAGGATFRKGATRIEISSCDLGWDPNKSVISFYVALRPVWVIATLVTDLEARGNGEARAAMDAIERIARSYGVEKLKLEPQPIKRLRASMRREELIDWYGSLGFVFDPKSERHIMMKEI